ncbi:MAG: hypothetical protein M3O34_15270 [Chloroflexota bacterium]|nr:hypothetical protein [Chloroflexota bacterium]
MNSTNYEPTERDELADAAAERTGGEPREFGTARLGDLSVAAAARIRLFLAEGIIKGGSTPAEVADLYLAQEIVLDALATEYLDRRFVHGEVPGDWRALQDALVEAHFGSPPTITAEKLLALVERSGRSERKPRSIFDDPEDLDEYEDDDDRATRLEERDPTLGDLTDDGRQSIERMVIADVLCYGIAPYRLMELRERLRAAGDERSLQYLDLPFELGGRPPDWDRLRDEALMLRAHIERRGVDPAEAYARADGLHPDASAHDLMTLIEDQADRRLA